MSDITQNIERQPVPGSQFEDLNLNLVREHIETALKRRGYSGPTDPEAYLLEHGCLTSNADGAAVPTLAGIVCFAREPHHRVSVCGIDVAQFSSSNPNTSDLVLSRTAFSLWPDFVLLETGNCFTIPSADSLVRPGTAGRRNQ